MRRLLYVPIIHSEADMGSAGAALAERSARMAGEGRWLIHRETVDRFWQSVAAYLRSFDFRQLKVYQDGLAANGELARRIVREAADRGSKNYQLVLEMIDGGAELRKTEDPRLLVLEGQNVLGLVQGDSVNSKNASAEMYRTTRDRLTGERDEFIAQTISATLKEGEVGVLFIGAYHDVVSRLAQDVSVEAVKDPERVRSYFRELFLGEDAENLNSLASYLRSPVGLP